MDLYDFRATVEAERKAWRRIHELATEFHEAAQAIRGQGGGKPYDGAITALWVDILRMDGVYPDHPNAYLTGFDNDWGYLQETRRRAPISNKTRLAVYKRDGYACLQCGADDNLTLDHIHPWSKGGSDEMDNLQTLCMTCNLAKGDTVA